MPGNRGMKMNSLQKWDIARKWISEAEKHEAIAREIEAYSDPDDIDDEEFQLNKSAAEIYRRCAQDLMWPEEISKPVAEIKF